MGQYVNPSRSTFPSYVLDPGYVDKTGLIEYTNRVLGSGTSCRICNSRPRRFGKTITASMLEYYYCKNLDADPVLSQFKIGQSSSYKEHLNKHNVIHLDIQSCADKFGGYAGVVSFIKKVLLKELCDEFPGKIAESTTDVATALIESGEKFIFIIDEWDAVIRDAHTTPEIVDEYMTFLRSLFKGSDTMEFLSLAYLTGILPIKRVKGQSALNEFKEYTMTIPNNLAPYMGFTEDEVKQLCLKHDLDFEQMKTWYDGYILGNYHVYNPRSVNVVTGGGVFANYWQQTGSFEVVVPLIDMDFDGLHTAILEMLSDNKVIADVDTFSNDVNEIKSKDDVLAYLVHLGYLAYDASNGTVFIPNVEIKQELLRAVKKSKDTELFRIIRESDELLTATIRMDGILVGQMLDSYHNALTSVLKYNDENSLSNVINLAYISTIRYYHNPLRELPVGKGFADLVYLPRAEHRREYPALLIELKWDKTADTAIDQIHERQYPQSLTEYADKILLVGINYDKKAKNHECRIELFDPKKAIVKTTLTLVEEAQADTVRSLYENGVSIDIIMKSTKTTLEQIGKILGGIPASNGIFYSDTFIRAKMESDGVTYEEAVKCLTGE